MLKPIKSSIIIAPDVKATTVNDERSTLVGAYGGKLTEDRFLIGAGGYWLADPRDHARLGYGGLVLGWRIAGNNRLSVGARGLVGFGQATIASNVEPVLLSDRRMFDRDEPRMSGAFNRRLAFRDDFFVAEPQVDLRIRLTDAIHVNAGAGYRATTAADFIERQVRGATVSVGLEFAIAK